VDSLKLTRVGAETAVRQESLRCSDRGRRAELERTDFLWRIKRQKSARTYHVFAMCEMEKNTVEKRVVTREAKTWKSRVNAIIPRVHSHFGSSRLDVPLSWPTDNDGSGGAVEP
jgi:hypothetical protein